MPDETLHLALPYLAAAQAQKHVTHNEALQRLDDLVQLSIADRDLASPPPAPAEGARYLVPAGASGAWSGHDGQVASRRDGAWHYHLPRPGWLAWIADEQTLSAFDGSAWQPLASAGGVFPQIGVNATPDAGNRLAVASAAALFTHAGAGHRLTVNKAASTDTASLILQTGYSGRVEIGTAGNDDLHVKVSADGATWREAMVVSAATGEVLLPLTTLPTTLPAYTVAGLPAAASAPRRLVYVSNESGGAVPAFSDGSQWRRVTDRAIVS